MAYDDQIMLHTTGIPDSDDELVVAILTERPGSGTDAQYAAARGQLDQATAVLLKALGSAASS
jgi:hypothetical protein